MKKSRIIYLVLTLLFTLAAVSEAAITLNVTPNSVTADGNTQATISAQLLGRYNKPLANRTIYFSTTGGVLTATKAITDTNGWAYTAISSTQPGEVTVTAKYGRQSATAKVTFIENIVNYPPEGIYSLLGKGIQEVESLLENESVKGISIRIHWEAVEPQEGMFDWTYLDSLISQAGIAGKGASITIIPGVHTPEWVYAKGARKFYFIDRNPYHTTYGQELYCPMPWDDIYLTSWKNFIEALAGRYRENPVVSWIRVTGPTNTTTGDWNLQSKEDWDKYTGTEDEFSDERLIEAVKQAIDWFATNTAKPVSLAIARTKVSDKPWSAATEVVNYGFANYPNQFNIQINSWNSNIPSFDKQNAKMELIKQAVPYAGAQMVSSATNDPYCRMNGKQTPCDPYASLKGAIDKAIEYNLSFLEIYASDIKNPELQDILEGF